jgi:hypothetical protein
MKQKLLNKFSVGCGIIVCLTAQNMARGEQTAPRKAAIFIENRAGASLNDKVAVLEDFLTSKISEKGFSVISREVVINALKTYPTAGVVVASGSAVEGKVATPAGQAAVAGEVVKASATQVATTAPVVKADQLLSDSSSALRLAQNMGADYLLIASITTLGSEKKVMDAYGVKTVNVIHTLRVSYKVLEGAEGGSLIGNIVKASKTTQFTEGLQTENSGLIDDLLEDAANKVADDAGEKVAKIAAEAKKLPPVEILVSCALQDMVQLPLSVPDIRLLDNGSSIYVSTNRMPVVATPKLAATVEIDGIAVGTAPGKFKVPQGLSRMRVTRDGFNVYERTIKPQEGQQFNDVALQMSEAGYARWKDNIAFLLAIKTGDKLTDGLREMMAGLAQTLRQSGYRVDAKTDVKATMEAKGKSLFDGATLKVFGE